jgi:long-chain fatty acid transport protein
VPYRSVVLIAFILVLCGASPARASGFRLPDQSASALGMAGAFTGQADDASAVWYNPAGMLQFSGTQVAAGVTAIYPVLTHETAGGATDVSERQIHLPPQLFITHRLNADTAFGLGVTSPFGLSTDWSGMSATRYVATFSNIVTTEINSDIAFQITPAFTVAAGVAYISMRATMEKLATFGPFGQYDFRLAGDGDGWGANAAALYRASDNLHIGLTYRSRIKVDLDGTAALTGAGPLAVAGDGSTSITLPDLIDLGVSYKASERLNLNADLDYTLWSTYDRLVISSNVPLFNATIEKEWHDVWCLRVGAQYALQDNWKLRGGLLYDKNPVPEATFDTVVPDADRAGVTAGVGYSGKNLSVDAAYMYLRFLKRTIGNSLADDDANPFTPPDPLNGIYRSQAHMLALTVGYRF